MHPMTTDTEALGDLFVDVTGSEETITQREEERSRDPIADEDAAVAEEAAAVARDSGLDDAVAGAETGGGSTDTAAD